MGPRQTWIAVDLLVAQGAQPEWPAYTQQIARTEYAQVESVPQHHVVIWCEMAMRPTLIVEATVPLAQWVCSV